MSTTLNTLLPPQALKGTAIGLSASQSEDLARLGLMESHFKLALRELARTVLVGGGTLVFGGNLEPGGYTWVLINELRRYADQDIGTGLRSVLHWCEHRRQSVKMLDEVEHQLGVLGELVCLDKDKPVAVDDRTAGRDEEAGPPESDGPTLVNCLTVMRRYLTEQTHGRLVIGGKRCGYKGPMPGLLQEALLSLAAGHPLYLAGGFGGITHDMTVVVDARCAALLPAYPGVPPLDEATCAGLAEIRAQLAGRGWKGLGNGLTDAQNLQLAATHRPAEIAALVSLGLGRVAAKRSGAATP
jgi:SLOG cluster2